MAKAIENLKKIDNSGFTLIETMISLVIFSIGILGIAALQTTATSSNTLSERVQHNTNWAVAQTETLLAADYTDERIANSGMVNDQSADGRYAFTYEAVNNNAIPRAKLVTVTSRFIQNGLPQTITVRCFKPFIQ
jgi:prepilin-type N-terminal cleavage/methylation domain-containing protein